MKDNGERGEARDKQGDRREKILRLHTGRKKTAETKREIKCRKKTSGRGNVTGGKERASEGQINI